MPDIGRVSELIADPGPWTFAYIDGPSDQPEPEELARQRSVRDRLEEVDAPEADVDAAAAAVAQRTGFASPSARFLLIRDGRVEVDESFAGARTGPERLGHGPVPHLLPLLQEEYESVLYLVVETSRDGATVHLERSGTRHPELTEEIEGDTTDITKVRAGNMAQAGIQRRSEEVWKHNQTEVAEVVDELVRQRHPAFIVLSGDMRARKLLTDRLNRESQQLLVEVDANTRADGSDDSVLEDSIHAAIERTLRDAAADVRDRAAAGDHRAAAEGRQEVVEALQAAQVDTLILDARLADAGGSLDALDAPPWVSLGEEDSLSATVIASVPAADALARAALLSGARVIVEGRDPQPEGEARDDGPPAAPFAYLRWSND